MNRSGFLGSHYRSLVFSVLALLVGCLFSAHVALSQSNDAQIQLPPSVDFGPYNGNFLTGGKGLTKLLSAQSEIFKNGSTWTMYCWVRSEEMPRSSTLLAGFGDPADEYSQYFGVRYGEFIFLAGPGDILKTNKPFSPAKWHLLAATFDGITTRFYLDGEEAASGKFAFGPVRPMLQMAPEISPWVNGVHFGGKIAYFTIRQSILSAISIRALFTNAPDFSLIAFEDGSKDWPVQTVGQAGYRAPQDPATMPRSNAPFSKPIVHPEAKKEILTRNASNDWTLASGWKLIAAPKIHAAAEQISQIGFDTKNWLSATVPGTVLTTMVDRGIYPDPDFGLNNLAIPESLNKQNYWYRVEFGAPRFSPGQKMSLTFNGINYEAAVWLNGKFLGNIQGAFIRGTFDVTGILKSEKNNVLAVEISPPPHPGIPNEQSVKGGPGENGGILCLDGPTFVATEGWDWIPGIRDRDTGIWQDVHLHVTNQLKFGDPEVITSLPLPDISRADVTIHVPINNQSNSSVEGTLNASFGGVTVAKHILAPPGMSEVTLTPKEFPQLIVLHPHLWWPNGYGDPYLYQMTLQLITGKTLSDQKSLHFGIREITYELSLLDPSGHLRRVEYSPTAAMAAGKAIVDVTHKGIREIPGGWVASLTPAAMSSPSIRSLNDIQLSPYLAIKVNGVRIAIRGGSWGMDDSRKRISRKRLEPYFRLQREANLNIIRNWVGQNTEETFYDLADEYGMLVWNDFWESTQDDNIEAEDPALFLANAKDTILRFRNHPSIVLWCGRNEGVPQPIINRGLDDLVRSLDGTRYYAPSSNQINLQDSGPYKYQAPVLYYTTLDRGFAVETGTQSMPTLESFRSFIPGPDRWPISDDWAYHDWHQSDNGDTHPFMDELAAEFGAATSLEDFERKAQMLNYVNYRAIFEGFNAHLWAQNSGRMLWMSHPAWPSTMWQIYSSDYDTQASFYAVKKACEPVHIQLDLSNGDVDVVNTTTAALPDLTATAKVFSFDNKLLDSQQKQLSGNVDSVMTAFRLGSWSNSFSKLAFVKLELKDGTGNLLSQNLYWIGPNSESYRALNALPKVGLISSAVFRHEGNEAHITVTLRNPAQSIALATKLTLENAQDGSRILPAYYSDNYVSLLPGETRKIDISYPSKSGMGDAEIALRGWNVAASFVAVRAN